MASRTPIQRLSPDDVDTLLGVIFGRDGGVSCAQFRMVLVSMLGRLAWSPQASGDGGVWHLACIRYGWPRKPSSRDWRQWFDDKCSQEKARSAQSPQPSSRFIHASPKPPANPRKSIFAKGKGRTPSL